MRTEELIRALAASLQPVPRRFVERRIVFGLLGGGAAALAIVVVGFGLRPDLGPAMMGPWFWMKWAYTISLGVASILLTNKLARPAGDGRRWLEVLFAPVLMLGLLAGVQLQLTPQSGWMGLWLGHSWETGPWIVLLLSLPLFAGLVWSYRRFAPTSPRLAGAAAGLTAGAWAATLYCLHCTESSALFVVTWYSLGISLAAALGMVVGPFAFRW